MSVSAYTYILANCQTRLRGDAKKVVFLGGGGAVGVLPQLSVKKLPLFVLLPFDADAFKTCKNTTKLF